MFSWIARCALCCTLAFVISLIGRTAQAQSSCTPQNTVVADIVALEQAYLLNRFSAFVPAGMLYALRHDVESTEGGTQLVPGKVRLRANKRPRPLVLRVNEGQCLEVRFQNLLAPTWEDEGGVPREHDDAQGNSRLPDYAVAPAGAPSKGELVRAGKVSVDMPRTRTASFHITGLELAPISEAQCPLNAACGGDGSNVGLPTQQGIKFNPNTAQAVRDKFLGSLAKPGQQVVTRWHAGHEGAYFAYSTAAPVGGEGDGGQIGLGLFASVNVEPAGSRWYRSQLTHEELLAVQLPVSGGSHPYMRIDYEREHVVRGRSMPMLAMLDRNRHIVHSDLNAVVVIPEGPGKGKNAPECKGNVFGGTCGQSFREFTVILHDEVHAQQAFAELEDENNPLSLIKDGMGINYGVSSMGSLLMSTPLQRNVGVAKNCPECRAEEFFLSSWANGDPALILKYSADGKQPVGARYPDDPSNVHHSYLGDPVRFRNLHAGPKETHVFHLHAHQWVLDAKDPNSTYLDSQTISPGATFSYGIEFGGSGNRNYTPGDSIFHCHLYPHFAQGMWELWRVHDVFEDGKPGLFDPSKPIGAGNDPRARSLPDAEVYGGIQNPALVPIPGAALAPLASARFRGYPFYIPGTPGHRPPQPVLDMDVNDPTWTKMDTEPSAASVVNGGLQRHVIEKGSVLKRDADTLKHALTKGGDAAQLIAQRVAKQSPQSLAALAGEWDQLYLRPLAHSGEPAERDAMAFHEGKLATAQLQPVDVSAAQMPQGNWWRPSKAYRTQHASTVTGQKPRSAQAMFYVNANDRAPGAPYANPCPADAPMRNYRAAFIQTELTYNKHGWFDPQGRIAILENDIKDIIDPATRTRLPEPLFFRANSGECINFKSSNFVPSALAVDDFQLFTPTDTIGQHIHLVKFDVTSSDGSGNGWNYEDGTFSPDEVRERIFAFNRTPNLDGTAKTAAQKLMPKAHPLFAPGGDIYEAAGGSTAHPLHGGLLKKGLCPPQIAGETDKEFEHRLNKDHPFCGAQRTTQRWWADPIINAKGKDNTLRTVFTHDHFGPSSHQQHGLYAGLVIEPANSVWTKIGSQVSAADLEAIADPAAAARAKLIGGSNLQKPTTNALKRASKHLLSSVEPRDPLQLRSDGGPTATMANVIAPRCIGDSDSNPLQPNAGRNYPANPPNDCKKSSDQTKDTKREFALAIADFGIAYNTALEPINPEPLGDSGMRDRSAIRFGMRHVATTPARPLAISSEDPGSQYVNYRHEPLALRISEATPDPVLGGFNYRQHTKRADLSTACKPGDQDCLGDPANAMSTLVHARRDEVLATQPMESTVQQATRAMFQQMGSEAKLNKVLADVEQWRRDFNCALYSETLLSPSACKRSHPATPPIARLEPWRTFGDPATPILPAFEGDPVQIRLVQGAQEAQHIFTMNGVKWHRIPGSQGSGYTNAQPIGISEHFEFDMLINPLGSPQTDYLYFGSSVDQLWDGMWGVLRSFSLPEACRGANRQLDSCQKFSTKPVKTSATKGVVQFKPASMIAPLQSVGLAEPRTPGTDRKVDVCQPDNDKTGVSVHYFDVSVVRVCDLFENCGEPDARGLVYSERADIRDANAIVYVLSNDFVCTSNNPTHAPAESNCGKKQVVDPDEQSNTQVLKTLQTQFGKGKRPLTPLILRAGAGSCMKVTVRNHLPLQIEDGPELLGAERGLVRESKAYNNFLPMIADGFNVNQFRTSSSVGLSAARVAQHPLHADGSNAGLNAAVKIAIRAPAATSGPPGTSTSSRDNTEPQQQGSLIPPCKPETPNGDVCKTTYVWSASDYERDREPVELGAVPLRSFGDPIKHPMHGLVGALVIGPAGSHVCESDRFARMISGDGAPTKVLGGVSAEVCLPNGRRYVDHVLVMQDAVSATHGGFPVGNLSGAEEPDDYGMKAINYKTEPLWARRGGDPSQDFGVRNEADYSTVLSSAEVKKSAGPVRCMAGIKPLASLPNVCDPETPVLLARTNDKVRLHFVHPGGHTRQQGLAISGHLINPFPWSGDSRKFEPKAGGIRQGVYNGFGPMMGVSFELTPGGANEVPMDYLIRSQASFLFDGGLWGLLRVEK